MRHAIVLSLLLLLPSACYRTHYENFSPANPNRGPQVNPPFKPRYGWQHFFVWGWFPLELPIDARQLCGDAENVHSIETQRSFLEGLVAAFAGYYVNIYSPWNGVVSCRTAPLMLPPTLPAAAPPTPPPPVPTP